MSKDFPEKLSIITASQNFTNAFADVGSEIDVSGYEGLAIWANVTKNDSSGLSIRILYKLSAGATDEYAISQDENIFQLLDQDQKVMIPIKIFPFVPIVQIQIKANSVGTTPAALASLVATRY